ncbi:MAG: lysine 2,3-aminomutase [Methylobacteriaceae bacterium]|nr:lysine 2,3-aminomutase [Methylobacteriaceae bacterium]
MGAGAGRQRMSAADRTLRRPAELAEAGFIQPERVTELEAVTARYTLALPPGLARLIDPSDPTDPIARQFVPDPRELQHAAGELTDPIGDAAHSPVEGLVHRYPDRVLLKLLAACPVYCRFCFRREMVGQGEGALAPAALDRALTYIAERPDIWEVILTGGDPLALSARRLEAVARRLAAIPHVKILRVHTRVPVAVPERIDAALIAALKAGGKTVYVALHANHPRELTPQAHAACARLIDAGIPMLGQTVLLRGVNDDVATLAALMRAFVETRIKPYYLHHPDLAPGTAHFRLSIEEGQKLVGALLGRVSGLCQPTYVLDIPGGFGKTPIGPNRLRRGDAQTSAVEDWRGAVHTYPPG